MPELLTLEGKVALVTGASRGIGRAVALELARRGAALVVNYLKSAEAAEDVVSAIQEGGGRGVAFQGDVSDYQQAQQLIAFVVETFGKIDILVNNAGGSFVVSTMDMSEGGWDAIIRENLK
ncbi:MAG: SDR family NAD(P)-dependent oxidoreductase, partial [Anaerolineales bacterium]|nr:SDR family NAD(P)-dependent oxidoreductase [Anaerolineales bacterium]